MNHLRQSGGSLLRKLIRIGAVVGAGLGLAACSGSLADTLGMGKRSPDEFAVVKRQPLIIPPDYALRPPDPNAQPPREARSNVRTRAALTGLPAAEGEATPVATPLEPGLTSAGDSRGEDALVARTQAAASDPAIRARLAEEAGAPGEVDPALFERLIAQEASAGGGGATVVGRETTPMEGLGQ